MVQKLVSSNFFCVTCKTMSEQQWTKFANQSKFKVDLSDKFWNYVSLFLAEMVIRSDTWLVYFPAITTFPPLLKWLFLQFRTFKKTFGSTKCEDCTKPKKRRNMCNWLWLRKLNPRSQLRDSLNWVHGHNPNKSHCAKHYRSMLGCL